MTKKIYFKNAVIANPKRHGSPPKTSDERLFPYYAGYSTTFAKQLLASLKLTDDLLVLDPWNGSGTTTQIANQMGLTSVGLDLNPVMVIAAKASLLPPQEANSLVPLAQSLIEQAALRDDEGLSEDPLHKWLCPDSAHYIRQLEGEINRTLISHEHYEPLTTENAVNQISALGSFFYVALFRTVRHLLKSFIPTNPTWIKRPTRPQQRRRPLRRSIHDAFLAEIRLLVEHLKISLNSSADESGTTTIHLGNAEALTLANAAVDVIVTSPPYCTRIDYAMATTIELAILRYDELLFDELRRSLMGTSTVKAAAGNINQQWGTSCVRFLNAIYEHPSKASKSYYFKNHLQYFESLQLALAELSRVLKPHGSCVLVVQDSYYKDIHNDVPTIVTEMAAHVGMVLRRRDNFAANRTMVGMNSRARKYLATRTNVESVLCFERT